MNPNPEYSIEFVIQYTIVGAILIVACLWIVLKIFRKKKNKKGSGSCCGCTLADSCKKAQLTDNRKGEKYGRDKNI